MHYHMVKFDVYSIMYVTIDVMKEIVEMKLVRIKAYQIRGMK